MQKRHFITMLSGAMLTGFADLARAQRSGTPGVTDREIKIGQTLPLSGPAASYATIGKALAAWFDFVNVQGGVDGRKLLLVQLDDGYSPPKTVEQSRRLVEREQVAFVASPVGTPTGVAARGYFNSAKVPQLFIGSGAATWAEDAAKFPWSLGWQPLFTDEGRTMAKHILQTRPNAKIAVLYQNDDAGKDLLRGLKEGLGVAVKQIVREESHEVTDPTVDSQVVTMQASGADVLVMWGSPKATIQSLRKAHDIGWKPTIYINQNSSSVPKVLAPIGLDKVKGVISAAFLKDPADPTWKDDPGLLAWNAFMDKYNGGAAKDYNAVYGTCIAQTVVQVLKQCGNDLSRENIVRQTRRLDMELPMMLPGLRIKTSDTQPHPVTGLRLQQFDGSSWKLMSA
ncbi:ABC transporter substrate-binding protein [Diaphorobacter ruginosibacter]|uniref:ABC transporter substrate-binding protein n=2 Tax=Diaphorobacter ruginosibacter TaxID=1715720 RepID=A0A7G9RVD9_9BURK|nr:ABC transporter substrate-binding protein [Diaphorobacter ruginosibacter]